MAKAGKPRTPADGRNHHLFLKEAFEKEEDMVFHTRTHPVKYKKERIWNPPSARYEAKHKGKRILKDANVTSSEFPLTRLTERGASQRGRPPAGGASVRSRGGGQGRPPRAMGRSGSGTLARAGRDVGTARSSMPPSARSFAGRSIGTARSSASQFSSASRSTGMSSYETGRSVSTELIDELRERKVRVAKHDRSSFLCHANTLCLLCRSA